MDRSLALESRIIRGPLVLYNRDASDRPGGIQNEEIMRSSGCVSQS
jgi:hypothetical protein